MTHAERERLEMAGYSWGDYSVCYRNVAWTDEQAAAFRKGWEGYRRMRGLSR